jgi:hypothetical protein
MAGTIVKNKPLRLRFHAVSIIAGPNACPQALALKGVRLLSAAEPPRLPLAGCARGADCQCRYQHHSDRRAGPRRSDGRLRTGRIWAPGDDRRQVRGRRDSDYED